MSTRVVMRILYDCQIFQWQKRGGISRYFSELITRLLKIPEIFPSLPLLFSENQYAIDSKLSYFPFFFGGRYCRGLWRGERLIRYCEESIIRAKLMSEMYGVFHPTYYNPYFYRWVRNRRGGIVLTIHDMIHEKFPNYFSNDDPTAANKKLLVGIADIIIAVSENTKNDIIEFYSINEERIRVIYHGNSLSLDNAKVISDIPQRYVLFVGSRRGYKNFTSFVDGIRPFLNSDSTLNVVCVGGGMFNNSEKELFGNYQIGNRFFRVDVGDRELAYLYNHALAFVLPSLYEGFGIPVLEAFACGCPVVLSRSSSLPEVGGSSALYFDPTSSDSLTEQLEEVLYNDSKRGDLVKMGHLQLSKFSWDKTAEDTLSVYRMLS